MWNLEIWSARHLLAELTRGRITGRRWSFSRDVNVRLVGLRIAFSTCQFHQTYSSAVRCSSLSASSTSGWTRVIVEKPFGRDSESSATLTRGRKQYLKEEQIFRYFDHYGIIRDIMQNHLLQIIALFAMETPISLDAEDIRIEKVKVLRSMRHLKLSDVIIGQYNSHTRGGVTYLGYIDDRTVPKDSLTPTLLQQLSLLIMRDGTVCLSL